MPLNLFNVIRTYWQTPQLQPRVNFFLFHFFWGTVRPRSVDFQNLSF